MPSPRAISDFGNLTSFAALRSFRGSRHSINAVSSFYFIAFIATCDEHNMVNLDFTAIDLERPYHANS